MNYIELFHTAVLHHPQSPALVDHCGKRSTSYGELDLLSGRVAGKLHSLGIGPGAFVGVSMDRRMEYIAAYLGILKAGCAVVPMVPDYPQERRGYICSHCSAALTVGEDFFEDIEGFDPYDAPADGAAPALLVYTSGSTGTPKGILYTAEDLARTAMRQTALLEGIPNLVFAAACMFSFIAHVTEYLSVFLMGGCSHILPDHVRRSADSLAAYYSEHGITAGVITTQLMRLFPGGCPSLHRVITGSERVSQIYSDSFEIYNVYGMSELGHTGFFPIDRPYDNTPVGKAIGDLQILICDESGNMLPPGSEGEIILRGTFGTTYYRDEERTAKCMTPAGGGRTDFHTGDFGYINENGDLVFMDRRDWMVKINGQRVETMEIEALLQAVPNVGGAAVKAFTDTDGQTYLAAYYVPAGPLTEEALREKLREKLPEYMIPRFFVPMDALPKNMNGKLDRKALLPPDAGNYKVLYAAPENEAEKVLCKAFEQILGCGTVGTNDDFFALGGDSIKVLRLIGLSRLEGLTADMVFSGKTPKKIAAMAKETEVSKIAGPHDIPAVCPLSAAQLGVYLEYSEQPDTLKYNIPTRVKLPEGTDLPRFIAAVETVIAAHPAFCITVGSPDGIPSMLYREQTIPVEEVSAADPESEFRRFLRPFDLEHGPLCRFEIVHLPEGTCFYYDIHHLIFDGSSQQVFLSQIAGVYEGNKCPEEAMTLFDEALAEAQPKDPARLKSYQEYFDQLFADADCDAKPLPDQLEEGIPEGCAFLTLRADGKFRQAEVMDFVHKNGINENALFLGAFGYALAKCNGTAVSFFNTANHGRHDARLADTVGMFVRMLPVVCRFDEGLAPADYLRGVYDDYFRIKKNDVIPFAELSAQYGANTDISFVYQGDLLDGIPMAGGFLVPENLHTGAAISDIEIMFIRSDGGYRMQIYYRTALYTEKFIRGFIDLFLNAVRGMMTAKALGRIALTDAQSRAVLDGFNATEAEYQAETTVVELFRNQAAETPDQICLVCRGHRYTYLEVEKLTDSLAAELLRRGVGKEKIVGVLINRSEYMLICALGVLKAGGAYLPLDPTYPPDRLNLMMQDSSAMLLIADAALADIISEEFTGGRLLTDTISTLPECDTELPQPQPGDLFAMLYTSGSTGLPKGVMYQHSNSLVTTQWVKKYFGINGSSRVTAYASYGFDANIFDMYPAVTGGAELHIISDDIRLDFNALRDYFNENGITHTVMTTQVGRQFALMGGLTTLRHLSVAGEKLTPPEVPEGFSLYNLYGPSEGSVITSAFRVDRRYKDVPIGSPVDNLKMYVVDGQGRLLPPGAVGELWIAGPHVTRGYLNRPEKTAEAFGETNPFEEAPGYQRIYRTGDIVRILHDGNLQYVGRRDGQVKVRGFRVELTEIEEVIRRFPGITDATVAAFDDPAGGKFVCAYVVSDAPVSSEALSDFIRGEKPPYMVPAVIMQIEAIPLNQNQKVNRKALPVPERKPLDIVPPETAGQQRVFDIVKKILGHDCFGIRTNLYDAGLTSIGAIRLNVALADEFGVPVKIADIKTNNTVELLERFLAGSAPTETYALQADYPITETQNGIFVECMANPDTTLYNIPVLFRLGAGVDLPRLAKAVKAAIDAHPYVKTVLFTAGDGSVRAKRQDDAPVDVPVIKCETLPERDALLTPFRLIGGQLCRAAIYETAQGNYLFMDLHHIISDGTSEAVLLQDIDRAYLGETLKPESFTGFEAALAEEALRTGDGYEAAQNYWTALLSGLDGSCLPQKAAESAEGGAGRLRVRGEKTAEKVKAFCEADGLTLNAYFNAVFSLVLSRFVGKDTVSYSTVYNGRSDSRLARAVTMLVKTIPTAIPVNGSTAVTDHIRSVQEQLMNSISNDACSFAELASRFDVSADLIFIYQGEDFRFTKLCGEPAELLPLASETAKAPISINVYLTDGCFEYDVEYRRDCFSAAFAGSLIDAVMTAADAFLSEKTLQDVSLCSVRAEAVYAEMNASDTPVENIYCHQFVERQAAKSPDALAVIAAGETLSFRRLNEQANIMAHTLIRLGVRQNHIIGLVLDRTKDTIVTELAIMKAGGAFLPMLPTYPDERISYCLTDSESPFVITTGEIASEKQELFSGEAPYRTLTVEQLLCGSETNSPETDDPGLEVLPDQLAYCIYTSGSTGTPKGVMIAQRNFSNFVQTDILPQRCYSDPTADGACLAVSSISFDMSLFEIWLPLCTGRAVCMATEEEFHNPLKLRDLMLEHNVQAMTCTPSFLNNMMSVPGFDKVLKGLRTVVVGAEAFPSALFDALRSTSPSLQIINGYGPTETTICCSMKELTSGSGITIGRPTGNNRYYVLDRSGHVQPPYAAGELIICGAGVGRGYVKLPEKNAASFFTLRGLPAYHSGDLVRLTAAGEIEFGGRMDNQVKLRGFRIELDEIENVMCSYGCVKQSKVLVRNNGTEDYLVGFFTASEPVDPDALTAHLRSRLTYYMVPAVLMQLEQMPLTPNGKIDKKGFPEVQKTARKTGGRRAAKKSLEQKLCEIFASVLGLETVYADDNFFELGGTSLSASKVTMMLMSDNIEVKYGDIFDHPTPETLAAFIEQRDGAKAPVSPAASAAPAVEETTREALKWNTVRHAPEVKRESLGNVLLTGAAGFLGIHLLNELLARETGQIYCLIRKGSFESPEARLLAMQVYYFGSGFEDAQRKRIELVDADITDRGLGEVLADIPFDTVINSAACVKHFSNSDILEQVNVHGVENLIDVCRKRNAKLIQISTTSVPGIHTKETYAKQVRMHENELFVIDDMDNKYAISKYRAELAMFDAIENGLRGKVIRVGNLMGRHSDGEFQVNIESNMFISGIRGFAVMGKYPISHMTDPMRFSPVDCTARAVVLLSGTNDRFTAFNCDNRYGFDEMKIIDTCNRNGITILPADDEAYYAEYRKKLADDRINSKLNALAAYDIPDAHAVDTDNLFTTNILYRIGFSWPLVDDSYLDRAIHSILTLGYFDLDSPEEG